MITAKKINSRNKFPQLLITSEKFISMSHHAEASKKPFINDPDLINGMAENILANGLTDTIIICRGKIADGRLRQTAISKLLAEGNFNPKSPIKCKCVSLSKVKNIVVARNILRQEYSRFEKVVDVVWRYWPCFDMWTAEAKKRKHDGKSVDGAVKGTVAQKFAEKAGVNVGYCEVAIKLRQFDERLLEVVFNGQLNHSSAQKFNRLNEKQRAEYLQYLLEHPTVHFNGATAEFKAKIIEASKKFSAEPDNYEVRWEDDSTWSQPYNDEENCEEPNSTTASSEDISPFDDSEIKEMLEKYPIAAMFPYRVCDDFAEEYGKIANEFRYISKPSVVLSLNNSKSFQNELVQLLLRFMKDYHIVQPMNLTDIK